MPRLSRLIAANAALIPLPRQRAQVVAAAGPLHLHDVGAQVGHAASAQYGTRDDAREVEDADSVQHHRALSHDRGIPPSSR